MSTAPAAPDRQPHDWHLAWPWWARGVVYQVYPRSFQDSDGDGCGDLPGILSRLDYLDWLGVDAIWISPFYPSPMKDFGYDVSDYTGVHPLFGTLADVDALLEAAHARGMKVILDFVPNHSSDRHPWFLEASRSRDSERRDWYLWADPGPGGGPPNNWISEFAGSAWQWHAPTGQYYYHAFLDAQPDLNWRNPRVREAMFDAMRFWLERGVDGFRVDVMWHLIKDAALRDNPPNPAYDPGRDSPYRKLLPLHSTDQPEVHAVVRAMRRVVDAFPERVLIGEIYLPVERLVSYYGTDRDEAHLPFNFLLVGTPWEAGAVRRAVEAYEAALPPEGWPNWVLGNHDQSRIASRIGAAQARVAAVLLLALRGTPTLYYGDEIGMVDGEIGPEQAVDPRELNCPGRGLGRDPERTPMQWDEGAQAGFTGGRPWLPLPEDFRGCTVAAQREDPQSLLSLYRRLLSLRRDSAALSVGSYHGEDAAPPLFAWRRERAGERWLAVLNFSATPQGFDVPAWAQAGRVEASTHAVGGRDGAIGARIELAGDEAVLVRV